MRILALLGACAAGATFRTMSGEPVNLQVGVAENLVNDSVPEDLHLGWGSDGDDGLASGDFGGSSYTDSSACLDSDGDQL